MIHITSPSLNQSMIEDIEHKVEAFCKEKKIGFKYEVFKRTQDGIEIPILPRIECKTYREVFRLKSENIREFEETEKYYVGLILCIDEELDDYFVDKIEESAEFLENLGLYSAGESYLETIFCKSCKWEGSYNKLISIENDETLDDFENVFCPICESEMLSIRQTVGRRK